MSKNASKSGRMDTADHSDPRWHIHQVAKDFNLIDAWRLPVSGEYEEFSELTNLFLSLDFGDDEASKTSNLLFSIRLKLGSLFGWDEKEAEAIPGCEEKSLRDRLSPELRKSANEVDPNSSEFQLVYQTETESVLELSNGTAHVAIHLAWVAVEDSQYNGQMGIYVKKRGRSGNIYMSAIAPFRYYIVYPALMRRLKLVWQQRETGTIPS